MKKIIVIVLLSISYLLLHGCANSRYLGWQTVKVESSVVNKPCVLLGTKEKCDKSLAKCEVWFKKRAILIKANTTVFETSQGVTFGRYYDCQPGLPLYEKLKFTKTDYSQGANTVIGQAFLTQQGGGVVTCAGNMVYMRPNNAYFLAKYSDTQEIEPSDEASSMEKSTQCDATGNFEFNNIQDGEWTIETTVSWNVPKINRFGNSFYTTNNWQGGMMMKNITVKSNEKNKFIITR